MIPLILLHIALHAQLVTGSPICDRAFMTNPPTQGCDEIYGQQNFTVCAPEHVIEIRTKRETRGGVVHKAGTGPYPRYKIDYLSCPDGFYGVPTDFPDPNDLTCERVTKTLWIDGQKWGVIKEVEEK